MLVKNSPPINFDLTIEIILKKPGNILSPETVELLQSLKSYGSVLQTNSDKWDALDEKISKYYSTEFDADQGEEYGDGLIGIGELAAEAFGYL